MPLEDRIAQAESALAQCEEYYRAYGLDGWGTTPEEVSYSHHVATKGALMVLGPDVLLQIERERVRAAFEAGGSIGFSVEAKADRLTQLRQRKRQLLARLEVQLRQREQDGDLAIDSRRNAEMFLASDTDLAAIIEGMEAA